MKSSVERGRFVTKSHSRSFLVVSRSDLSVLRDITKHEFLNKPTSLVCIKTQVSKETVALRWWESIAGD